MKLTVGKYEGERGFALPTILLISTVMMILLVASVAAAAASRASLDSQYYNTLAQQAAESGIARAKECLSMSGYTPQWATESVNRNLRPNSDCVGETRVGPGVSEYVIGDGTGVENFIKTKYSVDAEDGSGEGSILKAVGTTELRRTTAPYAVWRTYSETLYYRIEPPQTVACPEGFVSVPGDSRFGTSDFCVGKYEAKAVNGVATSQAADQPRVYINQTDAIEAAANACDGCHLITEAEWLTIAHNVVNVASNWTGGAVGVGSFYNGHNDNSPPQSLAASTDDSDGYSGTGNSFPSSQRRTLTLSNGEVIWDLAGNVYEWTTGQIGAGKPGGSGLAYREWNTIGGTGSVSPSPFPVFGTPAASAWNSGTGIGRLYSNSDDTAVRVFARSAAWGYGANAGVFTLRLDYSPTSQNHVIGFRIAK